MVTATPRTSDELVTLILAIYRSRRAKVGDIIMPHEWKHLHEAHGCQPLEVQTGLQEAERRGLVHTDEAGNHALSAAGFDKLLG